MAVPLRLRNTNTPNAMTELHKRYGAHKAGFFFFGDATGQSRKSSSTATLPMLLAMRDRLSTSRMRYIPTSALPSKYASLSRSSTSPVGTLRVAILGLRRRICRRPGHCWTNCTGKKSGDLGDNAGPGTLLHRVLWDGNRGSARRYRWRNCRCRD